MLCLTAQGYVATDCRGAPRVVLTSANNYILDADNGTADAQHFCRVVAPEEVSGDAYDATIHMESRVDSTVPTNYGTPGFIYNVQDQDNFDFVFFRRVALCTHIKVSTLMVAMIIRRTRPTFWWLQYRVSSQLQKYIHGPKRGSSTVIRTHTTHGRTDARTHTHTRTHAHAHTCVCACMDDMYITYVLFRWQQSTTRRTTV